jgi:hypothetical protein
MNATGKLLDGTLTPAYGRDYKTGKAAIADFEAGKDFVYHKMLDQGIVGKDDFAIGAVITIRFKQQRSLVRYTVKA